MILRLVTLLFALLLGLAGCNNTEAFTGTCSDDLQCPAGAFCLGGLCACRSNEACAEDQFCNLQHVCQKREGCATNTDCNDPMLFCDIASGACIARTACGTDVHCDPGSVCDVSKNQCVLGCRDASDCPLYAVCDHTGTSSSSLGRCVTGRCEDKSYCDYGQRCSGQACVADPNPVNCSACTPGVDDCGSPRNYCLINTEYDPNDPSKGSENFCAAECDPANQASCPSGYDCGSVVLLTQSLCTDNTQCGGMGRQCVKGEGDTKGACTCAVDDDCTVGSLNPSCLGSCSGLGIRLCRTDMDCPIGRCDNTRKTCQQPQGQACTQDDECQKLDLCAAGAGGNKFCLTAPTQRCTVNDDCLCAMGTCFGTGRPCNNAGDCRLQCQNGGCLLGAACAPTQGLTCQDLPHR